MHTSVLFSILPLLALPLPGMALPQKHQQKLPLPALLRRFPQDGGALDLPPSLNTGSITELPIPTITSTASNDISIIQTGGPTPTPAPIPSLWQINTVPETLLAQQNPAITAQATITSSPVAYATSAHVNDDSDLDVQGVDEDDIDDGMIVNNLESTITDQPPTPTSSPTQITVAEYQGDSLFEPTSGSMEIMDITAVAAVAAITSVVGSISTSSTSYSGSSITSMPYSSPASISIGSMTNWSASSSSSSSSSIMASSSATPSESVKVAETPIETGSFNDTNGSKKIRYKHCSETKGTVTEIKVEPCEIGKGTILDPCHFQAGRNYTITLSYVSPEDSTSPRANLVARDKTRSNGEEHFTYPGQAFDACQYTSCPIKNQETKSYIYNFETLNNRFDQLTFNMTNGLDGDSLMCAYFPITFMPNLAGRSQRRNLPLGGLGSRW